MKGIGKETTEYLQKELQGVIKAKTENPWAYPCGQVFIVL